jgi:hypothetical protein
MNKKQIICQIGSRILVEFLAISKVEQPYGTIQICDNESVILD